MPRKPLELLLIAPPTTIVGGQAIQASRLLAALSDAEGVHVTFLPAGLPRRLCFLRSIPLLRTAVMMLCFHLRLLWRIRSIDLLHVFTASGLSFLLTPAPSLVLARLLGKKSILNYRDGRAEWHLREWRSAAPLIRCADVVVAPSDYLVDVFKNHTIAARSVFNIIDPSKFRYRERRRPRPVFLHNRGLEQLYNVPCMMRAFALVQHRYPDATLIIAHDGPLRGQLEVLRDHLGLVGVEFVGEVGQSEMADIYDNADIYWMCPDLDCMPGSILECYASGLPVISSNAGGIPYILTHERTGLLVNRNDPEGLAHAAFRLLEEDSLALRITEGGRRELAKYTSSSVREEWLSLYSELMSEGA